MSDEYWQRQNKDTPLFADLIWSRPENKQLAGKLLIIGGNAHGFAAPAEAFQMAGEAGVGSARVVMPLAVKKLAGKLLETVDYAPNTPSGSFSKASLTELMLGAEWADSVLVAGDLGRNSETAIVLEKFMTSYKGQITLTKDAADYGVALAKMVLSRPETLLVLTIAQLQKLFMNAKLPEAISFDMGLINLVDVLHDYGEKFPMNIIVKHSNQLIVSSGGFVSTTPTDIDNEDFWRVKYGTKAAVWWLQNPSKTFEALTTSIITKSV